MALITKSIKGTQDVLPSESHKVRFIEQTALEIAGNCGFREIRIPVFEHTELFQRGVGDTTDVVQKEMYTFLDKGERSITLRPEGTAGVVRSYLENGLYNEAMPQKLCYLVSCYRYEKPQAGRLREFHQFGLVQMFHRICQHQKRDYHTQQYLPDFFIAFSVFFHPSHPDVPSFPNPFSSRFRNVFENSFPRSALPNLQEIYPAFG